MERTSTTASTLGLQASFGFGDRIGIATAGHIEAMRLCGGDIAPIFAQQSIREMARTARTPGEVMQDALDAIETLHWSQPHGADADHLKTPQDVRRTAAAGFTFFTIDPSDHVDQKADDYDEATLRERLPAVRDAARWLEEYRGQAVTLATGTRLEFNELALIRAAVKYGPAIQAAIELARHIHSVQSAAECNYEIELSVDETEQPTTLVEHYIIADQCLQHDVKLVSLAPRFIGQFEKGVDYIGDVVALERSLADHAAMAESLGPYKLSLHSGSDKLSMYPALARATKGRFHVKTAGTSYLEALRVTAMEEPALFRRICQFARERYETDRATYHVHATLDTVLTPDEITDDTKLQDVYLERWETVEQGKGFTQAGRQILHCTYGSVLTDATLGPALRNCLEENRATYTAVLTEHFARHLQALQPDVSQ